MNTLLSVIPGRSVDRCGFCFSGNHLAACLLLIVTFLFVNSSSAESPSFDLVQSTNELRDNSAVDIVEGDGYLWFATSLGVSATSDGGITWITWDTEDGLNSDDISALAFSNGTLWVATAHAEIRNDESVQFGDGFNYTGDFGQTWNEPATQPSQASSALQLSFDLAIVEQPEWSFDAIYSTCFAGGLIRSTDHGETWHNIFASPEDSIDFVDRIFERRTNLYYSVVIDTSGSDTLLVWAGTAAGLFKYGYIDESLKLAGMRTFDMSFDGEAMWLAVDGGVSRGLKKQGINAYQYWSWDSDDGMLSDLYTAIEADSQFVIAAAFDESLGEALGFNITTDDGNSWVTSSPDQAVGPDHMVKEIARTGGVTFAACGSGGLIRTIDDGVSWTQLFYDSTQKSPDYPVNRYNSLFAQVLDTDSVRLWTGTDSGIVVYDFVGPATDPDSVWHIPFDDTDSSGQTVQAVYIREYEVEPGVFESQLWVATHATAGSDGVDRAFRSTDGGETWNAPLQPVVVNDFQSFAGRFWLTTPSDVLFTIGPGIESSEFFSDTGPGSAVDSSLMQLEVTDIDMWVSSREASVRARPLQSGGFQWVVERVNDDPLKYDFNVLYDTLDGISGNWVTALGLQYTDSDPVLWASTRKTESGVNGVSYTSDDGREWRVALSPVRAWNYAFDDEDVYVAASEGLFVRKSTDSEFNELTFSENARRRISPNAEFFAVRVSDGVLWAASNDGIVMDSLQGTAPDILREFSDDELPYASPLPSSPTRGLGFVRFHYKLTEPDNVTIRVYDFAMNLVKVVVDNEPRDPREGSLRDDDDSWDMRNGNGDIVAAGVYFFVIEKASGETSWGKLMVLP